MKNIVLFNGKIETLAFFSWKIADILSDLSYNIIIHEFYENSNNIISRLTDDESVLITFNCMGVSGEDEYKKGNISLWAANNFKIINILVDHPMYYHDQLSHCTTYGTSLCDTLIVCIDRFHVDYIRKYYPEIKDVIFMPLAGSSPDMLIPYSDRKYDVIFTGNFTPCTTFDRYIYGNGPEYAAFYRGIIDDKIAHPSISIETVCEQHILRDIPDATARDISFTLHHLIFTDLYVRFYFREKIIRELINNDVNLRLVGKGFEHIKCKKTLSSTPLMPTDYCIREISASKISLNIMPGFCDGGHDRIFSSMLCNSACASDGSKWLYENFSDNHDICFYDATSDSSCFEVINGLLYNNTWESIALHGHKKALEYHTWHSRVKLLLNYL